METLKGLVDIHVHADPDQTPRSLDVFEVARLFRDRGARAIVLMNHYDQTAGMAYLVRKQVEGLEVYGGLVLNHLVGGMNPHAVEHFTRIEGGYGRIVYMPTVHAENEARQGGNPSAPQVRVSERGQLLPEVLDMLDVIAGTGLALSTGHSSPKESILLAAAAQDRGVREVFITNALYWAVSMSTSQIQEAADLGASIELIYYDVGRPDATVTMEDYAEAIAAIGAEHFILSSCGGQAWLPVHTFAWSELFRGMRENGISEGDLDLMTRRNPSRLLGLD